MWSEGNYPFALQCVKIQLPNKVANHVECTFITFYTCNLSEVAECSEDGCSVRRTGEA